MSVISFVLPSTESTFLPSFLNNSIPPKRWGKMDEQKPMPEVCVADPSAESEPKQDEGQCQVRRGAGGSEPGR